MSGLLELAERVEKAEGPDRELAKDIARAIGLAPETTPAGQYGWKEDYIGWRYLTGEDARVPPARIDPPNWLSSLDAAMTLVPEAHEWSVGWAGNSDARVTMLPDGPSFDGFAATPALALTAAALSARAAISALRPAPSAAREEGE